MKYIKQFENVQYKVGDFVKIKMIPDYVSDSVKRRVDNLFVTISKIEPRISNTINDVFTFETILSNQTIFGFIYLIDRKMTKTEIKDFKIKKDVNKYNL